MTENATVYSPLYGFPSDAELRLLAPGADVQLDAAGRAVLRWPDGVTVALTRLPDHEMGVHLAGLCELLARQGAPPAVPIRVLSTLSVFGVAVEPRHTDETLLFVASLAVESNGFFFLDGRLTDCDGSDLLVPTRPTAERVAQRALLLVSLAFRGLLEQDANTPEEARAEALRGDLREWVRATGVDREAEPRELAFLDTPIGHPDPQSVIEAVWRAEGSQVLLWALGARVLPPHDAQEHPFQVGHELGILAAEPPPLLDHPALRPPEEIEWMRRRLLGINWRMTQQRVQPGICDFPAFARDNWFGGFDITGIPIAANRDLAVGGFPVAAAHPEHVALTTSIALERHHAINWVVGAHPVYSHVATPT